MATYIVRGETLTGIADAIREKSGAADALTLTDMSNMIQSFNTEYWNKDEVKNHVEKTAARQRLPESLTAIGHSALRTNPYLVEIEIPANVATIGLAAFKGCTALTTVIFNGTPTSIDATTFDLCDSLTNIYVPWSEGAVANAPFGATNATITYDYTEVVGNG